MWVGKLIRGFYVDSGVQDLIRYPIPAMLIAMLVTWVRDGRPIYPCMLNADGSTDGQTVAYGFSSMDFHVSRLMNSIGTSLTWVLMVQSLCSLLVV